MPDFDVSQKDYTKYRIERSKDDLEAVHLLFDADYAKPEKITQ